MLLFDAKVFIYSKAVDMRKSINGLSVIVSNEFNMNPTEPGIFLFWNKNKDKLKALYWHINGFCLFYKRLEKSKFKIPDMKSSIFSVTTKELRWLLEGLDFTKMVGYKNLHYECFS